jgi:hypothetical protein
MDRPAPLVLGTRNLECPTHYSWLAAVPKSKQPEKSTNYLDDTTVEA